MANPPLADNERVFWSRFSKHLNQKGIKPESVCWYRIRAEQFIRALPNRRLASLTPDDISGYLLKLGESPHLKPWQYLQVIDAIQILYKLAHTEWSDTFDWDCIKSFPNPLTPPPVHTSPSKLASPSPATPPRPAHPPDAPAC